AAGGSRHDDKFFPLRLEVAVDGRAGTDERGIDGVDEQSINGGRPGVEGDPFDPNTDGLFELAGRPRVEGLRMSDVGEIRQPKRFDCRLRLWPAGQKQSRNPPQPAANVANCHRWRAFFPADCSRPLPLDQTNHSRMMPIPNTQAQTGIPGVTFQWSAAVDFLRRKVFTRPGSVGVWQRPNQGMGNEP